MPEKDEKTSIFQGVALYMSRQADGLWRYFLEQTLYFLFGWFPGILGIAIRGLVYRLILKT